MITTCSLKKKITIGCLFLLGSSVSAGAIVTEVKGSFLSQIADHIKKIPLSTMGAGDVGLGKTFKSIADGLAWVPGAISSGAIATYSAFSVVGTFLQQVPWTSMFSFFGSLGGGEMSSYWTNWMKSAIDIKDISPLMIAQNIGTLGYKIILGGKEGDYKDLQGIKKFISENIENNQLLIDSHKILAKALIMMFYAPTKTLNGIRKRWTHNALKKYFTGWDPATITDFVLYEMDPNIYREKRMKAKKKEK